MKKFIPFLGYSCCNVVSLCSLLSIPTTRKIFTSKYFILLLSVLLMVFNLIAHEQRPERYSSKNCFVFIPCNILLTITTIISLVLDIILVKNGFHNFGLSNTDAVFVSTLLFIIILVRIIYKFHTTVPIEEQKNPRRPPSLMPKMMRIGIYYLVMIIGISLFFQDYIKDNENVPLHTGFWDRFGSWNSSPVSFLFAFLAGIFSILIDTYTWYTITDYTPEKLKLPKFMN